MMFPRRFLSPVLALLVLLAACTGNEPAPPDQTDEPAPVDRTFDLGTHALHARIVGEGSPAVVIDVGIASRSEEWYPLQDRLAGETQVLVYDRAGYGASEPGPVPRDSGTEADELEALLDAASVASPIVLVGHSLGALNAQVFAARYPEDVAGLVLLDPPPLGWLLGEGYPELRALAEQITGEWQATADRGSASSDPGERAEATFFQMIASEHREMLGESARLAAAIETFGDTPLVVIASGVPNPAFGGVAEEYQRYWAEESRALALKSSRGRLLLAEDSSHMLHLEAQEEVIASILVLVAGAAEE